MINSKVNRISIFTLFAVLSLCVLLGEENQSIVLVLCSTCIIGLYFIEWLKAKTVYKINRNLGIFWSILLLSMLFSSLNSLSLGYSISNFIKYLCAFALYVYYSNKIIISKTLLIEFLDIFFYWIIVILLISYVYILSPLLQSLIHPMNLIYKTFGHNHIVDLLFFILPYSFYLLKKKKTLHILLAVIFLTFGVLTSSSRGAMILLSACLIFYLWKAFPSLKKILRFSLSLLIVFISSTLIGISSYVSTVRTVESQNSTAHYKTSILESRLPYWTQAMYSIQDNAWIGQGPGSFSLISKRYQQLPNTYSWFAHNFLLQSLAEIGVFGVIAVIVILYFSFHASGIDIRKRYIPSDPRVSIFLGLLLVLVYSFVEINLDFTVLWVIFWSLLGLLNQRRQSGEIRNQFIRIPVGIPLFLLFAYSVSFSVGMWLKLNNKLAESIRYMPYSASVVEAYLQNADPKNRLSESTKKYLRRFHAHNPDILAAFAAHEIGIDSYNTYMREALISDPQNRSLLESYIVKALSHKRSEDIKFVIHLMMSTISVDKDRDKKYINDHWKEIEDCFNTNTLIWNDSPFTDTYQEKSMYFASLCLAKKKDFENAKELLRIASGSKPSWSYIYVDYASIVWWYDINYEKAMSIINLCKENIHAKQHCSEFETGDFLSNSVFDATINFEK